MNCATFRNTIKSTIVPDRRLTANKFKNKNSYPYNLSCLLDHGNELDYSVTQTKHGTPRNFNISNNFGFRNKEQYTVSILTSNNDNDHRDNEQIATEIKITR